MALVNANQMQEAVEGFHTLPIVKQLGLLVGLAASIAMGVWVVLWAQKPDLAPVFRDLPTAEITEILDTLQQSGIKAKGDPDSGTVWVPVDKVSDIRLQLAAKGLPKGSHTGFTNWAQDNGFGASKFIENVRFKQAMEQELARTIASIASVRKARVHLALPRPSVFVRDQRKPSASVFVDLHAGKSLEKGQVQAIANMVASGIPDLTPGGVTVIDQWGRLLTDWNEDETSRISHRQLEYTRAVEREYVRRIEEILTPVLGDAKVRAQVTADMDFTVTEKTQELFSPNSQPLVRSEQTQKEQQSGNRAFKGIPGALTNQPPVPGSVAATEENAQNAGDGAPEGDQHSRIMQTRNYELDKTIAYIKQHVGTLKRLSVAVVVDDMVVKERDGRSKRVQLQDKQMDRITELVREAVGFSKNRGDTVTVVNSSFIEPDWGDTTVPEIPFWQKPFFWHAIKQAVAGIFVLVVLFSVIKPLLTTLAAKTVVMKPSSLEKGFPGQLSAALATAEMKEAPLLKPEQMPKLPEPSASYGAKMDTIRSMVKDDPGRVAQVVLNWIGDEE